MIDHNVRGYSFKDGILMWKNNYILSLKAKGINEGTIYLYSKSIDEFTQIISNHLDNSEEIELSTIRKSDFHYWLNYLLDELEMQKSTVKTRLTIIKSFFKFITEENEDLIDFLRLFKGINVKTEKKEKIGYTDIEIAKILNYIENIKRDDENISSKAISIHLKSFAFLVLLYTGLRASELLSLRYSDLLEDGEFYKIRVRGKGSKERFVYITKDKLEEDYKNILVDAHSDTMDFIFVKASGKLYARRELHSMMDILFKHAAVRFKGVHELRHTFARRLVTKNINLTTIQGLLGHSDISVTANFYAKTNENNKKDAIKNSYHND